MRASTRVRQGAFRFLVYLWALPYTLLGATAGLLMMCFGARMEWNNGVAEFHGGLFGHLFAQLPETVRFGAITFGHVVLSTSHTELTALRAHEFVHVRQYERWGVLFLPAYALSSVWQLAQGRNGYKNNYFERQAYAAEQTNVSRPPIVTRADIDHLI